MRPAYFFLPLLLACATTSSQERVVISLQDIDCESCGARSIKALKGQPGVGEVAFDRDKAELTVAYDEGATDPEKIRTLVAGLGFGAEVGAGKGRYLAEVGFDEGMDVVWISKAGEDVDVAAHLAPEKVTVVDFYATWCGPCRDVDRALHAILELDAGVAVRKLNVVDWDSAVAKRYLKGVTQLPYVEVYDASGERVDAIAGLDLDRLRAAVEKASSP